MENKNICFRKEINKMKTLILYATKYGATEEIAQRIANDMGDASLYNLKEKNFPSLELFDCIILGSSLYAGSTRKEFKAFIADNLALLNQKKLGIFFSGMGADSIDKIINDNPPLNSLEKIIAKDNLGGIYDPQKVNKMERFIYKLATKQSDYQNTIDDTKVESFAQKMMNRIE